MQRIIRLEGNRIEMKSRNFWYLLGALNIFIEKCMSTRAIGKKKKKNSAIFRIL